MAFILRSTRLLYNLAGCARHTRGLLRTNEKLILVEHQNIFNFNKFRTRSIALSAEKKEEDPINSIEEFERELSQLEEDFERRRVFKRDVNNVFKKLREAGEMKDSQLLLLLRCCTEASFMCSEKERVETAQRIWNSALKFGTQLDVHHFNALLSVYVGNHHKISDENFLNKMKEAGVQPNRITYKLLLKAACQKGDVVLAKHYLEEMKNLNYSVNVGDFNSLILCYSKIGEFEKAHEILEIMKERGINPETNSYASLLCGYIESKNLEKFKEVFEELYAKNITALMDYDLLRIIYTLALHNQQSHIDMVLEKLKMNRNYERLLGNFLQRLLHKRLDSLAIRLLETIDIKNKSFNYSPPVARFILEHFACYRRPTEILNISEQLEEKGYAKGAVGFSLRKVLELRNEQFAFTFLKEMKARKLLVKCHYYWPLIIQASKKGNKKLLSLCKTLPAYVLNNPFTELNVILYRYAFSEEWDADIEKLWNHGIPVKFSAWYLMMNFLNKNQLDEVEKIVSTYSVQPMRLTHIFNILFSNLASNPEKVEQVVNIIYNHYHDVYLSDNLKKEDMEELNEEMPTNYFSRVVPSLLRNIQDETVIQHVLEAMLEKKMCISSESGSETLQPFQNQKLDDLVKKLSDPNLKIEMNKSLLERKSKANEVSVNSFVPNSDSVKDIVYIMRKLTNNNQTKKALEVAEKFLEQKKEITKKHDIYTKKMYRSFLHDFSSRRDVTILEKLIDLGMRFGILEINDRYDVTTIIQVYLKCGETHKAIEKFKEVLLETGKVFCMDILVHCISNGKTEEVQKIIEFISEARTRNHAFTYLVFALTSLGEVEKAQKILDSTGFTLRKDVLLWRLRFYYKDKSSKEIENFVQVLKRVEKFDLTFLYKILVQKYAEEKEVSKIQQFISDINMNEISDKEFLQQLSNFKENLDFQKLAASIKIDFPEEFEQGSRINFLNRLNEISSSGEVSLPVRGRSMRENKATLLAKTHAYQGNIDEVLSIVESEPSGVIIPSIANAFLMSDKVNEYFTFVNALLSKGELSKVINCLKAERLFSALEKSDDHLKKYESLLHQCAEQMNSTNAVLRHFAICVALSQKLQYAEKLIEKYPEKFANLSFWALDKAVNSSNIPLKFYENVLSSEKFKNQFRHCLHMIYDKIIRLNCERNNLDDALKYLDQAVGDKVEKSLSKVVILMLENRLKKEGKNFPYSSLLQKSD